MEVLMAFQNELELVGCYNNQYLKEWQTESFFGTSQLFRKGNENDEKLLGNPILDCA